MLAAGEMQWWPFPFLVSTLSRQCQHVSVAAPHPCGPAGTSRSNGDPVVAAWSGENTLTSSAFLAFTNFFLFFPCTKVTRLQGALNGSRAWTAFVMLAEQKSLSFL